MIIPAIILAVLTSCVDDAASPAAGQVEFCAKAPKAPPVPGEPRTTATIAAYANSLRQAYYGAVEARDDCASKLEQGTIR